MKTFSKHVRRESSPLIPIGKETVADCGDYHNSYPAFDRLWRQSESGESGSGGGCFPVVGGCFGKTVIQDLEVTGGGDCLIVEVNN